MPDLVRPVIFDALAEEYGWPLGPVSSGLSTSQAVPADATQALPVVEPKTEPFPAVEVWNGNR